MVEKILIDGNEAAARGAIDAGCEGYFGYPITPQSEITEYMSREMHKLGRVFCQSQSELGSIYMLFGGAMSGKRTMTSTSGCGFALMAEGISYICASELPCVIVNVARMGPGIGTGGQGGQTDYAFATKAPGHGGHRCIVIAPWSPQEVYDQTQLAFHLADKYGIAVIVLSDFIVGRMAESVELKTLDFGPRTPPKVVVCGSGKKGGRTAAPNTGGGPGWHLAHREKYRKIADAETRWETYMAEDANFLIAAYGSTARMAKSAVDLARAEGLKVGLFRPITVWPFPAKELREAALTAGEVLVVEDGIGEMHDDVEAALQGRVPLHLLGAWGRNVNLTNPGGGIIHQERILEEVKRLI